MQQYGGKFSALLTIFMLNYVKFQPPRCGNQGDSRVKRQVREKIGAFERTPSRTSIPVGFTDNLPSPSTGFTDNLVVETRFVNVLDTEKVRPRKESDNRYCSGLI